MHQSENKETKLCFLIPSVASGGIEMYLLRFLKFYNNPANITIIVRGYEKKDLYEEYKKTGVKMFFLPLGYLYPVRFYRYYQLFLQFNFNTVCDFNSNFAGIPLWIARIAGVKTRIAFYRQGKDHFEHILYKDFYNNWANKLVNKNATHILANSYSSLDYFFPERKISDTRFKVINNGVDAKIFNLPVDKSLRDSINIPENAFVVGHCGRLDKVKNHATILKVARALIQSDKNIFFLFCGQDTHRLQPQVDNLGLTGNIRLLGFRTDVNKLLKIMNLFYFPSITEGQPNALIEAMISGLPFVASDIKPIKEVVPHDLHKWLVSPYDVDSACRLILRLKKNMGDNPEAKLWDNSSIIERFDSEKRFTEFLKILVN